MIARAAIFAGFVILGVISFAVWVRAQTGGDRSAEFKRISEELSAARLSGGDENEALQFGGRGVGWIPGAGGGFGGGGGGGGGGFSGGGGSFGGGGASGGWD